MTLKLLNRAHEKTMQEPSVISARKAMTLLGISNHTFQNAVDNDILKPRAKIDYDGDTSAYGFDHLYIEEVRKILLKAGKNPGKRLFTDEIKAQIQKLNKRWFQRGRAYSKDL